MSKMSSAADCRGSKLITPDYYWLWFFCMSLAFHGCTSCYFSILFALITLTSSKSESQSEAVWINAFTAGKLAFSFSLIMLFTGYKCSRSMVPCLNSSQRNCLVLIYSTPNTLCYTLSFDMSVLLLRAACKTSEIAAIFQNVKRTVRTLSHLPFPEYIIYIYYILSECSLRLTVSKLSFPNNWNSYGSRSSWWWRIVVIGSECLTKNTAVSQKCQQNVSKIAQRHEYRLPSAATILCSDQKSWKVY